MKYVLFILAFSLSVVLFIACSDDPPVTNIINNIYYQDSVQWEPTNGPYVISISNFNINDRDELYVFGIDYYSDNPKCAIYKSTDYGKTWNNSLENLPDSMEVMIPYYLTSLIAYNDSTKTYYRSSDEGYSWYRLMDSIPGASKIQNSAHTPITDSKGNIFVCALADHGSWTWYRSMDNGSNWSKIKDLSSTGDLNIDIHDYLFYYYRDDSNNEEKLIRSTDHGSSWTDVCNGGSSNSDLFHSLIIDKKGNLYRNWLYWSTDAGSTWKKFGKEGLYNLISHTRDLKIYNSPKGYLYIFHTNQDVITNKGLTEITRSTDQGNTWHPIFNGFKIKMIDIDSKGYLYAVQHNGRINRSKKPIE